VRAASSSACAWCQIWFAVPVELVPRDPIDGFALALGTDPVVNPGGVHRIVIKELAEHIDRDSGVGVPLGVGVPVGVGEDAGLVELGLGPAVPDRQRRQGIDPGPVIFVQRGGSQRLGAVRVHLRRWEQLQPGDGGVRVAVADALLLIGDQPGGGVGDVQFAPSALAFKVVVD